VATDDAPFFVVILVQNGTAQRRVPRRKRNHRKDLL
jgi:hypothetical protein